MSRHRQSRDYSNVPPSVWKQAGWDEVSTPFGLRIVPRGQGWREAAKWAMWRWVVRMLGWALVIALAIGVEVWVHGHFR